MRCVRSGCFFVTCEQSLQILRWDGLVKGIVDEELGVELWYDACAVDGLICITGGDLDWFCDLQVGVLVLSLLALATPGQLFHGFWVYGFYILVRS